MATYTYKNITVNVSHLNPQWVEHTGETVLTVSSELVSELVENCCTFNEFFLKYQEEELYRELEEDEEAVAEHYKNLCEEVEVRNADAIIAVYEYCLGEEDRQFNFDVDTENISWVIHDILHAVHDTAGCTIYVESEIEEQRILKSLAITKEQFPSLMPDFSFLEELESQFYQRFKSHLDLEEFKEYEEEYY